MARPWLEQGPWRLLAGASDLSLVQFHDLAADGATALVQARPRHERMGISSTRGFVQDRYVFASPLEGYYDAVTRRFRVVVHARDLSPEDMLDAAVIDEQFVPKRVARLDCVTGGWRVR